MNIKTKLLAGIVIIIALVLGVSAFVEKEHIALQFLIDGSIMLADKDEVQQFDVTDTLIVKKVGPPGPAGMVGGTYYEFTKYTGHLPRSETQGTKMISYQLAVFKK